MRQWYELRVRERTGQHSWAKKSKFYKVHKPADAVRRYEKNSSVEHTIMWCQKDKRHDPERRARNTERLMINIRREQEAAAQNDVKGFLNLGSDLLKDLWSAQPQKNKVRDRRYHEQRAKEAAHQSI